MAYQNKYIVLVFTGTYLPGYKAGGPVRSIVNMVDHLNDEFYFKIVTLDRDLNDNTPYPNINIDNWNKINGVDVFYMGLQGSLLSKLINIFKSKDYYYDIIYLNSFFSLNFTIKPLLLRRLGIIPCKPVILAPRGEFSPGALGLKRFKKQAYMMIAKLLGLYRGVLWVASSVHEELDIRCCYGKDVPVIIMPNLPPLFNNTEIISAKVNKKAGYLKILFLSRISKMKNLLGALQLLHGLEGEIQFDIYGPMEDSAYWAECQKVIVDFQNNIKIRYCGSVPHKKITSIMRNYDIFFLPTLGENFGHVILEALCAGCPVLISNQTPWRDLEKKKVGWDIPLDQPERFRAILQDCVDMNYENYIKWSRNASKYGMQITKDNHAVSQTRELFRKAMMTINFDRLLNQETSNV